MKRRKIQAQGPVYRGQSQVGVMRLDAWERPAGVLVGTIKEWPAAEYPLGHAVSEPLVMSRANEIPLRMYLPDGTTAVFHIGSRHGTLVNGRCIRMPPQAPASTGEPAPAVRLNATMLS